MGVERLCPPEVPALFLPEIITWVPRTQEPPAPMPKVFCELLAQSVPTPTSAMGQGQRHHNSGRMVDGPLPEGWGSSRGQTLNLAFRVHTPAPWVLGGEGESQELVCTLCACSCSQWPHCPLHVSI